MTYLICIKDLIEENLLKRHSKPENDEKQAKKWDLRRQRDEIERNRLLRGRKNSNNKRIKYNSVSSTSSCNDEFQNSNMQIDVNLSKI